MIRNAKQDADTERAAQYMVNTALETLATTLASYLAAGMHQPAENGRRTVVVFLEGMADAPLNPEVSEDCDATKHRPAH